MFEKIFKYSPDQPRDEKGQWTDSGGKSLGLGDRVRVDPNLMTIGGRNMYVTGGSLSSGFVVVGSSRGKLQHSVHSSQTTKLKTDCGGRFDRTMK